MFSSLGIKENDDRFSLMCLPLMASWAKYLTSMSVSVANFSSTGLTSSRSVLRMQKLRRVTRATATHSFVRSGGKNKFTCHPGWVRSSAEIWLRWSARWPPGRWTSWGPREASAWWWCPDRTPPTEPERNIRHTHAVKTSTWEKPNGLWTGTRLLKRTTSRPPQISNHPVLPLDIILLPQRWGGS